MKSKIGTRPTRGGCPSRNTGDRMKIQKEAQLEKEIARLRAAFIKLTAWIAQSSIGVISVAEAEEIIKDAEKVKP